MPHNRPCPSLQNEPSEFHAGVCDLSPLGPRCLISAWPSWLFVKRKKKEKSAIKGEKGEREARTERVGKPPSVNSFLFNPSLSCRKLLCGDETKGL